MSSNPLPGFGSRFLTAWKSWLRSLTQPAFAQQVSQLLNGQTVAVQAETKALVEEKPPAKPVLDPLQLLAILQREGRLIDFLMEDIQSLPDAQIGAAVREVHSKCRAALNSHVPLVPVVETAEDESMTVNSGYDPSSIRVVGNLGTSPPYTGTVRHRGWKASALKLQPLPSGQNPMVLAAAEIEVN